MDKVIPFLSRRPLLVPAVIAVLMLMSAGAVGPRSHWYFHLLRWVVCAAAVALAAYGLSTERAWAGLLFGALAVLFNPVVPVHLARKTWQPIDAAAGVAFIIGAVLLTAASDRRSRAGRMAGSRIGHEPTAANREWSGAENRVGPLPPPACQEGCEHG
jgi:hypothetical protein